MEIKEQSQDETEVTSEKLLNKSRDVALIAVQIYNNPLSKFRTESYIVHMIIAWNCLLQAIFVKKEMEIYEKNKDGDYVHIGTRKKTQAVEKLADTYFTDHNSPNYKNIDFIIKTRNEIEHSTGVDIDMIGVDLFGECQSLLLNFETCLIEEFGIENQIEHDLSLAIQFSKKIVREQADTQTRQLRKEEISIKEFVENYRNSISEETYNDERFRLSMFMIPRVSNNRHADDIPVVFNKDIVLTEENVNDIKTMLAVKFKTVPSQEEYKLKPKDVVERIKKKSKRKNFSIHYHTMCWYKYNARPREKDPSFTGEFALFDIAHKDYVYSERWVNFLIGKLKDDKEYSSIANMKLPRRKQP